MSIGILKELRVYHDRNTILSINYNDRTIFSLENNNIYNKEIIMSEFKGWEEVQDEELWEDGELSVRDVKSKIFRMLHLGKYKLIREKL